MQQTRARRVPLPDYRPAAFHTLWRLLGEADAGLEWGEVAIRELIASHSSGGAEASNLIAQRHGIRVNDLSVDCLRSQWARLQVTSVAQYLELFLDEFRIGFPRKVRERKNKEDLVSYTLNVFDVSKSEVGDLQCDLLDYYRKIRNSFLHDPAAVDRKTLVRQAQGLKVRVQDSQVYALLQAPNPPAEVCFDDFVLFSRALKDFAKGLCSYAVPNDDELMVVIRDDSTLIGKLRRISCERRRLQLLVNYVHQHFGFVKTAESKSEAMLESDLLAYG